MTSAFHFLGVMLDSQDRKVQLEFRMTLVPSTLKFTVYLMDRFTSYTLNSERFDFKARAHEEDLESRREWFSSDTLKLLGEFWVVEPIESRGKQIESSIHISWGPCFSIIRWQLGECCMHVAVRPSPPYRTWVKDNLAPVTWSTAVTHANRMVDRFRGGPVTHEKSSSSTDQIPPSKPSKSFADQFCQAGVCSVSESSCQTIQARTEDVGVGPDLIHLITTLVPYRSVESFHKPWPVVWVTVFDERGVIHGTRWTMPTPVEDQILLNVFPPETTHEFPQVATTIHPTFVARVFPKVRPPPPPFPRPEPPAERPGYVPVPAGIRAVFTTPAALLRSQPEMNHPRRQIAPRVREGMQALSDLNVVDIANRWALRLDNNPEINPTI